MNGIRTSVSWLRLRIGTLSVWLTACSSAVVGVPPAPVVVADAPPVGARASATVRTRAVAHLALSAHADRAAQVWVQAVPDRKCEFTGEGGGPALEVYSDPRGLVRVYAGPFADETGSAQAQLRCAADDGSVDVFPVQVTASRDQALLAQTQSEMLRLGQLAMPGEVRPPLQGDPAAYTPRQLFEGGYGMRPDPVKNPRLYARWLDSTRRPLARLAPAARAPSAPSGISLSISANSDESPFWNLTWSGIVAQTPFMSFKGPGFSNLYQVHPALISADFTIPWVQAQLNVANFAKSATWVGLGGNDAPISALWQVGVLEETLSTGFLPWTIFQAVWQFLPQVAFAQTISQSVGAGEDINVWATICNDGNPWDLTDPSEPGAMLCMGFQDFDNGSAPWSLVWQTSLAQLGFQAEFNTGELIQERPSLTEDFPNFSPGFFVPGDSTLICDSDLGNHTCGPLTANNSDISVQVWDIQSTESGRPVGTACLGFDDAICSDDGDGIWFYWDNPN